MGTLSPEEQGGILGLGLWVGLNQAHDQETSREKEVGLEGMEGGSRRWVMLNDVVGVRVCVGITNMSEQVKIDRARVWSQTRP